jgi:hypothetical protein
VTGTVDLFTVLSSLCRLKNGVNMTSLIEYKKKDEEFRARLEELESVTAQRNQARKEYEDLRRKRLEEFMSGFGIITLKLKEMYQMITLGKHSTLPVPAIAPLFFLFLCLLFPSASFCLSL